MGIGWLGADKRVCGLSGDVAFYGRSAVSELWQIEPRYMLTGGVIGAFITYTVIKSFDALTGKISASDRRGADPGGLPDRGVWLVRVEKAGFEWRKAIGAAVAIAGIVIFRWE